MAHGWDQGLIRKGASLGKALIEWGEVAEQFPIAQVIG